ncbi:hypothetical protein [Marinobacterium arenosum]|uniref:hypothetical protein n=1 Tax=Marinobacterium arenosum TaxID=2862496 RepID=UPI001C97B9FD|nr:hypothetical protein [Marinobacterium arenosum]MBY4677792.1 hypothetical protein [Marinobacterium arenosum]
MNSIYQPQGAALFTQLDSTSDQPSGQSLPASAITEFRHIWQQILHLFEEHLFALDLTLRKKIAADLALPDDQPFSLYQSWDRLQHGHPLLIANRHPPQVHPCSAQIHGYLERHHEQLERFSLLARREREYPPFAQWMAAHGFDAGKEQSLLEARELLQQMQQQLKSFTLRTVSDAADELEMAESA